MKKIKEITSEYDIKIIEDASHAIGGMYSEEPVGNCRYSDATVFSFHLCKDNYYRRGGAVLSNQPRVTG